MITVKELMMDQLYTLKPTNTVHQARDLMLDKQVRHIPIVDNEGKFIGLVTKRDILAASISSLAEIENTERDELEDGIPIAKIMISDVVIAQEDANLLDAAQHLLDQKYGCLPIFRDDKLVGILTEADFVRLAIYLMKSSAK